jgi:transposase
MLARRARVIIASAEGLSNQVVARKLRVSPGMVVKWRSRFLKARLAHSPGG